MATMLFSIVLVAVGAHFAPQAARRDILFGVTVPAAFRDGPVGRRVARHYAIEVWLFAATAALFVVTAPMPETSGLIVWAQTVGAFVAFARAWSRVRPHAAPPATIREASIEPPEGLPGGVLGQLGPFLLLLAAAVYVAVHWESVPDKFPTHWNLTGKADGWTTKSVGSVFRGVTVGVLSCSGLWFTSFAVLHWSRLPRVTGPEGRQARRVRRVQLLAMLGTAYFIASLLVWTMVVSMFVTDASGVALPLPFRIAPFAMLVVGPVVVRVMRRDAAEAGMAIGDTTPDACWWFGRIYANRQDPALFVERRFGLGYTLNLGNGWSWLVIASFLTALSVLLLVP